jgi:CubicO group peptidase (beta-lactamase class C family)
VGIEDRFHIGSDSKAFTSLLAGQFVEDGRLRWDSTLAEVFPELKDKMDAEFAKITLQELLSHSSGLASDGSEILDLISRSYMQDGNMDEVRYWMVKETAPSHSIIGLAQQRYVKSHRILANCRAVKDFRRFRNSQDGTWFSRSVLGA